MTKTKRNALNRSSWKKALKLYVYIKPYRRLFVIGLIFLFLSSTANLLFPKLLGDLVDAVDATNFSEKINEVGWLLIAVLLAQSIFSFFRIVIFVRVTEKTLASLRQATYNHLIRLPLSFFNQRRVGELNSRISADISLLQETFTTTLAEFLRQMIIIVGGIALLLYTSPSLTVFMLLILPPVMLITVFFGRFIRKYAKKAQAHVAESQVIVEETMQGIFNVKAYVNEAFEVFRYRQKTNEAAEIGIKGGIYRAAFASFIVLGLFGAIVAVIWRGSTLIASGEMQTGQLFSFIIYSGFIGGSIGGLADVYARIQKAVGATEDLMEIFDEETEDISLNPEQEENSLPLTGKISIQNLHFSYPSRPDISVLDNVNIEVEAGEQLALVGASGAGKSTLASLLLRMYNNYTGSISFDGTEARDIDLYALRKNMAIVPQEVLLFGGTIAENIAYGKPGATEAEIREAARKAYADEFITRFPEQYETVVGERGVQLSGGQRQRIAIARAFLKNPAILILDEATSALDSESEQHVQNALHDLMKNRTSIVIAHRLSTVRKADRIAVLDKGSIVETGTHEDLLNQDEGVYRQLTQIQNFGSK